MVVAVGGHIRLARGTQMLVAVEVRTVTQSRLPGLGSGLHVRAVGLAPRAICSLDHCRLAEACLRAVGQKIRATTSVELPD